MRPIGIGIIGASSLQVVPLNQAVREPLTDASTESESIERTF